MRENFTTHAVTIDDQKGKAFNVLRQSFSKAIVRRFHSIKDSLEDVWDLANSKALLANRLKDLAAKDPTTWTPRNLVDIALLACILWNGIDE